MAMIPFFVFLFCLFLIYAMYLLATRGSDAQRERLQKRLTEALLYTSHTSDAEVRLVRDELMSEIPWLNRALVKLPPAAKLKRFIDQADLQITVPRLLLFSVSAGILAMLALSMVTTSLVVMIVAGTLAAFLPFAHVMWTRRKRLQKFLEYLPDTLELMSRAMSAGHAFSETLHMVSTEMPEPIATEFRKTYEEQNLGLSLKLALENLAERIPSIDLRMCITAVLIQRETGGNLSEILEKVAFTVRERFRIMEELNTLTIQSRMGSWILCAMPVVLALGVTAINPEYMNVFWRDPRGQMAMYIAIAFQITGMLVIRKIMRIKI